jgi:hypothetical protein
MGLLEIELRASSDNEIDNMGRYYLNLFSVVYSKTLHLGGSITENDTVSSSLNTNFKIPIEKRTALDSLSNNNICFITQYEVYDHSEYLAKLKKLYLRSKGTQGTINEDSIGFEDTLNVDMFMETRSTCYIQFDISSTWVKSITKITNSRMKDPTNDFISQTESTLKITVLE